MSYNPVKSWAKMVPNTFASNLPDYEQRNMVHSFTNHTPILISEFRFAWKNCIASF